VRALRDALTLYLQRPAEEVDPCPLADADRPPSDPG